MRPEETSPCLVHLSSGLRYSTGHMTAATTTAETLLRQREAKGLRVTDTIRTLFGVFGAYSALAGEHVPPRTLAYWLSDSAVYIGFNVYFLLLLRKGRGLAFVGISGLLLDVLGVTSYSLISAHLAQQLGYSPRVAAKGTFTVACITFVAISSLPMRPLSAAVITLTSIGLHVYIWVLAVADPRTVWTGINFATPAVGHRLFPTEISFVAIVGGTPSLLAWAARRTVLQAVELEAERSRALQLQAQLVMEAKLGALGSLVAGISHDMNTPVGTVKTNADSLGK